MTTINTPFDSNALKKLKAGDSVLLSGVIYTARDSAHKLMVKALENGETLPFDIENSVIYYAGPTPAKPHQVIGSCGPTTSGRMDKYAPLLMDKGLKGMIGKGDRSDEVVTSIVKNGAVYFAAVGGAGALISKCVKSVETVAYEELGTEAIRRLEVKDFPLIVVIDSDGNNLYKRRFAGV